MKEIIIEPVEIIEYIFCFVGVAFPPGITTSTKICTKRGGFSLAYTLSC